MEFLANVMELMDGVFTAVTGLEPTVLNYDKVAIAIGVGLVALSWGLNAIEKKIYRTMTDEERAALEQECRF